MRQTFSGDYGGKGTRVRSLRQQGRRATAGEAAGPIVLRAERPLHVTVIMKEWRRHSQNSPERKEDA